MQTKRRFRCRGSSALALLVLLLAGCSSGADEQVPPGALVVDLPGAAKQIDFDDIVYSQRLNRIIVPARGSGLYLVDPDSGEATRVVDTPVASANKGGGLLFLADRNGRKIIIVDPANDRVLSSTATAAAPDYIRYVPATQELWVTEPRADPTPGIEIFAIDTTGQEPSAHKNGFVDVPGGPEGLELSASRHIAYTHGGRDLVAIDLPARRVVGRLATGCAGTHGFPRVDDQRGVVLASCAEGGAVTLVDLEDGHQLGQYRVGGGESLPGYSVRSGHFYVRSDPGATLATLQPTSTGLTEVATVTVPEVGHCLTADNRGHYWTCDANNGRLLRFEDNAVTG